MHYLSYLEVERTLHAVKCSNRRQAFADFVQTMFPEIFSGLKRRNKMYARIIPNFKKVKSPM